MEPFQYGVHSFKYIQDHNPQAIFFNECLNHLTIRQIQDILGKKMKNNYYEIYVQLQ